MDINVLTVSSKGQVVLPVDIRNEYSIKAGSKLAVYSTGEVIMLKPVVIPTEEDFELLLKKASDWAESVGYKEEDVDNIIKEVRRRKRTCE